MKRFTKEFLKNFPDNFFFEDKELVKWFNENTIFNKETGFMDLKEKITYDPPRIPLFEFPENVRAIFSLYSFCIWILGISPRDMSYEALVVVTKRYLQTSTKEAKKYAHVLKIINSGI